MMIAFDPNMEHESTRCTTAVQLRYTTKTNKGEGTWSVVF